ncbi:MAG: glycosyltransferase family 2 protein [Muribaculaceae bacterium]|nr:glycosyltransferase family 2 protein [Muribaculaceae bacterium]
MISVVIPLYNKEKQILTTLQSVWCQTFTDYEVIVVDDGSTDGSVAVVESVTDPRLRLLRQENGGVSGARNHGIAAARGEYVALLDGDDEWHPEFLEQITDLIQRYPECDVFASDYEFRKPDGTRVPTVVRHIPFDNETGLLSNYFKVASDSNSPVCSSTVCISKKAVDSVNGFPEGIKSGEDLLTWARLASRYGIAYTRRRLAVINIDAAYERSQKPKRVPAQQDYVGAELEKLKKEYNPPYISRYISFWHKMRSVIYFRLGMTGRSRSEAFKAVRWNPLNVKAWALMALNLLPARLRKL